MIKHLIKQPFFSGALLLYLSVHLSRMGLFYLPELVNSYLTDLLCLPIILSVSLISTRFIKRDHSISLTLPMIAGMTFFYAWYFEWYLPAKNPRYMADIIDVWCYLVGAFFYWRIIQPYFLQVNNSSSNASH